MTQPTPRAVHIDQALTNISIGFVQSQTNFVAGRVFPNIPVQKQSDLYYVFNSDYFYRDDAQKRAPGTEAAKVGYEIGTESYFAEPWAIKHAIPDQVAANVDAQINLERNASELVMQKLLIRREKDFAAKYFTAGVWANEQVGAPTPTGGQIAQWSDQSSGDPVSVIRAARTNMMESTGMMPNVLVTSQRVIDALMDHPDIIDRIKYSGGVGPNTPAVVTEQLIAQLFGVDRLVVMRAIENAAPEGLPRDYRFIGGNNALLAHAAPAPGLMTPSAGYTFSWQGYLGQSNEFGIATTRRYRELIRSTEVEGEMAYDQKLVAADLGHFFSNIVAAPA